MFNYRGNTFKGLVHPKTKLLPLITRPHIIPNPSFQRRPLFIFAEFCASCERERDTDRQTGSHHSGVSCLNRGLCTANIYEVHHCVCHATLFPLRLDLMVKLRTLLTVFICDPGPQNLSLKTLRYICNNSQKYIVWVKIIIIFLSKIIWTLSKYHVP